MNDVLLGGLLLAGGMGLLAGLWELRRRCQPMTGAAARSAAVVLAVGGVGLLVVGMRVAHGPDDFDPTPGPDGFAPDPDRGKAYLPPGARADIGFPVGVVASQPPAARPAAPAVARPGGKAPVGRGTGKGPTGQPAPGAVGES